MTGQQFRAIRRHNRITQYDYVQEEGTLSTRTLYDIERESFVPPKYVKILSKMISFPLDDDDKVAQFYNNIPDEFKKIQKRQQKPGFFDGATIEYPNGTFIKS